MSSYLYLFKDFIYLSLERRREGGREGEKHRCVVASHTLGTWPATQACALTGSRTCDPLVRRLALNPLSHASQGSTCLFHLADIYWAPACTMSCEKMLTIDLGTKWILIVLTVRAGTGTCWNVTEGQKDKLYLWEKYRGVRKHWGKTPNIAEDEDWCFREYIDDVN